VVEAAAGAEAPVVITEPRDEAKTGAGPFGGYMTSHAVDPQGNILQLLRRQRPLLGEIDGTEPT
jgi:hypothetical protein